jgi:hypothetical protein
MTRQKRTSATLETAISRASGMRSLDATLDYGHGLNIAEYETRIQTLRDTLTTYNDLLTHLDSTAEELTNLEQSLRSYSEKMLLSTAARYGKTSTQYMQAGGTIRKTTKRATTSKTPIALSPEAIPTTALAAAMN